MTDLVDDLVDQFNNGQEYQLNDYETNYLKELDALLVFHIHRVKIISNFVTYVAFTRLGYKKPKDGYDIQYSLETLSEPYKVRIKEVQVEP